MPGKCNNISMALCRVKLHINILSLKKGNKTDDWTAESYWLTMGEKVTRQGESKK